MNQYVITNSLKLFLMDIAKGPQRYGASSSTIITNDLEEEANILKAISYILTEAIKNFLSDISDDIENIKDEKTGLSELKFRYDALTFRLKYSDEIRYNFENKLNDKILNSFFKLETVSDFPEVQFIYWAIKNMPRLCIFEKELNLNYTLEVEVNPTLKCDLKTLFNDYIDKIFSSIDKLNNEKEGQYTSKRQRNYLVDAFLEQLLSSDFYKKEL